MFKHIPRMLQPFDAILEGIRKFKVDNKANGLAPTGVLASPTFFASLSW